MNMKNIFSILLIAFAMQLFSQTPQGFNYSAVARDAAGKPLANRNISVQLNILKTSATGALQYAENHSVNTDGYGLFNLVVGSGAVQSGNISNIQWGNDNHYLKVAIDANGGSNFITMGTTQIMSVPYALNAKKADNGIDRVSANGDTLYLSNGQVFVQVGSGGTGGFTHYIGEQFGGGVIFHLWKDDQGTEHGLIVDLNDLGQEVWSNVNDTIGITARSTWNGLSNSNAIVSQAGHIFSAAALCLNSINGGQNDWYLPAIDELSLLWHNRFNVNKSLSIIGGATVLTNSADYWSSTEDLDYAWAFHFRVGYVNGNGKDGTNYVRAVRAF
jgi:hypothetical protein